MSENFTIRCPECSKVIRVPVSMAGKTVGCPNCEKKLRIPAVELDREGSRKKHPLDAADPEPLPTGSGGDSNLLQTDGYSTNLNPAYKAISNTFQIDDQKYLGTSIASEHHIFLVIRQIRRSDLAVGAAGALGGLLGGLIVAALSARSGVGSKAEKISSCLLSEIPLSVVDHPDWPLTVNQKNRDLPVLIIPKDKIRGVKHRSLTNYVELKFDQKWVNIEYMVTRGASVRNYLVEANWPLQWKGETLSGQYYEEKRDRKKKTSWTPVAIFAVIAALALAVLLPILYHAARHDLRNGSSSVARSKPKRSPKVVLPPAPVATSLDQALGFLKTERPEENFAAWKYLADEKNFIQDRRVEVSQAIFTFAVPNWLDSNNLVPLKHWLGPEAVPLIKEELESGKGGSLAILYGELAGTEAAPYLAANIGPGGSHEALDKIGPEAARFLLPHLNSSNLHERRVAKDLLHRWKTDVNLLIRQCYADTESLEKVDQTHEHIAVQQLLEYMLQRSDEVEDDLRQEINAKIETKLQQDAAKTEGEIFSFGARRLMVKCLEKYPGENTDSVLVEVLKSGRGDAMADEIAKVLRNFDSEVATDGLVYALLKNSLTARDALGSRGSVAAAKKVVDQIHLIDSNRANTLLSAIKSSNGVPYLTEKCIEHLNSGDQERIKIGIKYLSKCEIDPSQQPKVSKALSNALDSVPSVDETDTQFFREICSLSKAVKGKELAEKLLAFLDSPNKNIFSSTVSTLANMQEPSTYPPIIKLIFDKEKQKWVADSFKNAGTSAEPALLSFANDPGLEDPQTAIYYFRLFGGIGSEESLRMLPELADANGGKGVKAEIKKSIKKVEKRLRKKSSGGGGFSR